YAEAVLADRPGGLPVWTGPARGRGPRSDAGAPAGRAAVPPAPPQRRAPPASGRKPPARRGQPQPRPVAALRLRPVLDGPARRGAADGGPQPDIMRWRLSDPDLTVPPLSLAYRDGGRLTGFAVAMLNKQTPLEPPILEIIDLVALDNDST